MQKQERVYVSGTFDLVHAGHIRLFRAAKEYGTVIASVNTDEFCARYKRKPILTLEERMLILSELRCVDEVIVNIGDEDSKPALLLSKATIVFHGDDWTGPSLYKQMGFTQEWLDEHGVRFVYFPRSTPDSTTNIIKRIKC